MRKWAGAATDLETLFDAGAVGRLSDGELLARFVRREDVASSEAAFAALVSRHGPMVLGICRRMLGDDHDAADAFQAVFLVLARKARLVRVDDTLGRWLYGVSIRVSRRARAVARAERARVRALDELDPPVGSTTTSPEDLRELRSAIDEEIARLPGRYRSAVVLCYLEGLTQEQAARRLRCSIRTVESRLRRARERLRPPLARRGLAPAAWCSEMLAAMTPRAELPPTLAASACQMVSASAGTVPLAVARLTRSTMRSLSMSRGLRIGWMLVALGLTATGAALLAGGQGTKPVAAGNPSAQVGTPAEQPGPAPAAHGRLEIRAIADVTGQPIEGAVAEWQLRVNNGRYKTTKSSTDRDGRAVLEWPSGATVNGLNVTARKPGFVPYSIWWDDTNHPLRLPAVKEIRCVNGAPIGGIVKDEAGAPVAGAKITVQAPPAETELSYYRFNLVETTTDAQGRWRFDDAPADLSGVFFQIEARRFLPASGAASRKTDEMTVLKRGFTVKGRVLDAQGQPIAGASVHCGDHYNNLSQSKTDAGGEFLLESCSPGASVVTVRAAGHSPDLREVHPEDRPTVEFRLGLAHTLRGKVVDREGHPVAGMTIATETWRGHQSLDARFNTDKDGRFEWRDAPGDAVLYSAFKDGYMSRRNFAMTADGAEAVVTVDPVLTISGKVSDAETGQPLSTFRVVRGMVFANNPRIAWQQRDAAEFRDGHYSVRHSEPFAGYAVRIEVPGYKPAESRVFRPGEAAPTFDFAMTRAAAADLLTGFVYRPNGRPAAGAEVALATPEHSLLFQMERFQFERNSGVPFTKTDPVGRFTFDKPGGAYLVVAMSDDGYAEARPEDMAKSPRLTLAAWGKIKGRARIGRQPAANQLINFQRRDVRPAGPDGVNALYGIETRTDLQGNFAFDRVIPGAGEVSRVVVTEYGNGMQQHMGCWQEPVDIAPGQTVLVQIGARGRPVVGRVVLQPAPGVRPVDWRQNRPATIEKARVFNPFQGLFGKDLHQFDRFAAGLDKDGRFRIDDVPPGHYELTVTIDAPLGLNRPGPVQELGRVKVPVEVPKGDDDVPIDLGEIKADVKGR
jgi:RNA polymerase sigma factor (sigma-70 family)